MATKKKAPTSHKLRGTRKKIVVKPMVKSITPTSLELRGASNKTGVTPLGDRILLKPLSYEELNTTSSGIIIPDTVSKEKPEQGVVIAVGEGRWQEGKRVPVGVKVGDKVVFSRYGYDEVKVRGEEYYILKEENILAIIN